MRDKLLIITLVIASSILGIGLGMYWSAEAKAEVNPHLIASMEEARDNHLIWLGLVTDNRSYEKDMGGRQWHLNWVVIYDDVIRELR